MNETQILTPTQKKFLGAFAKSKTLSANFYLTGGTALAGYYIPYRCSEDLDFFSEKEFSIEPVLIFIKSIKEWLGYKMLDFNESFNRNLVFLSFDNQVLKTEFTYFPFPQIEIPKDIDGIKIDSVLDIAVNKLFTIYQKPRSRDFMDLYMINNEYKLSMEDVISKARAKFDWHIDPIKLGAQFLLAKELKDYPILLKPLDDSLWQNYFENEAKNLGNRILE